ncbi:MAG: 2-C-methyl-D-erythritol 4-phosphate cytidylyltransferase [Bacteroidales bacterium]|nr:2-C-methyl-D-erythritol 4-phosphate cytidylyltransferase [Bacteroidales bacterium]
MAKKVYGVFVAGGSGVRMGSEVPKQFLELGGRPILQQSIMKFIAACPDLVPVVALPADHIPTWKRLCVENRFDLPQIIVEGGITRFHSVRNALEKVPDGAIVLIHDGVRPLVSTELIKQVLEVSAEERNVIPVCPVTDTLKSLVPAGDGTLTASGAPDPSREGLYGAQTPQLFLSEQIRKAYKTGYNSNFTDDASVARAAKIPLTYIEGERYNIKITTPEDLELAGKLF